MHAHTHSMQKVQIDLKSEDGVLFEGSVITFVVEQGKGPNIVLMKYQILLWWKYLDGSKTVVTAKYLEVLSQRENSQGKKSTHIFKSDAPIPSIIFEFYTDVWNIKLETTGV